MSILDALNWISGKAEREYLHRLRAQMRASMVPDPKPYLLVIGHGRHGKDTVCEILRDTYGFNFVSSSEFVGREIVWDRLKTFYHDYDEMFVNRNQHRALWADLISAYNYPDKTRTASEMKAKGKNIYCGMRRRDEYEACMEAGIFDRVLWVDRSQHLPPESSSSMELDYYMATDFIDNNGTVAQLHDTVHEFVRSL